MRRYARFVPLVIVTVGLLATVWLPFVNRSTLWGGLPPVMLWSAVGVFLLTPCLALLEYGRRHPEDDDGGPAARDEEVRGK